ncbi:SEC14-like protein 2 [Fopius arisanus]|uniref:SEC14-like protein 2 n=1 Tax=Fopius arisanus TaxID=64838 RepID=A0A9R1TDL7_9HYME|nr:PREDICTED: SEC14-like protein 2 [Fopius arisanus]
MNNVVKSLADDERFALMKFRRSVQDVLQPYHDDHFLLRWLRARKWDPVGAEKMLRDSLEWRRKWEVDSLDDWDEPQVLKDHLPYGHSGFDKDGAPADGNPRFRSKICQGGKVPKEMYKKNFDQSNEDFTTVIVKKGDKMKIDFVPEKLGSILSWEFRSENHDIRFGVLRRGTGGEKVELIPVRRVAAHQLDEVGVLTCEEPGTYSVVFDNSYSLLRNKKIHYNVRLAEPTEGLQELAFQDI